MKIVVLDGYALNPGDLSWEDWKPLGELVVYDRTSPDELLSRAGDAEVLLTNKTVLGEAEIEALPALRRQRKLPPRSWTVPSSMESPATQKRHSLRQPSTFPSVDRTPPLIEN